MTNQLKNVPEGYDPALWEIAQKRASFKGHLLSYVVVNAFLWGIWIFNTYRHGEHYMWPVWPMLGWGIGLAFHFMGAYVFPKANLVENEYQKLKNKQ
jgi:2TM domain